MPFNVPAASSWTVSCVGFSFAVAYPGQSRVMGTCRSIKRMEERVEEEEEEEEASTRKAEEAWNLDFLVLLTNGLGPTRHTLGQSSI